MEGAELDSGMLLEEMLRRGEQAVFPTLRKCVERFVDIVNHEKTQHRFRQKMNITLSEIQESRYMLKECIEASTVRKKLQYLKEVLNLLEKAFQVDDLAPLLYRLCNTGFIELITEENLDFLSCDELTVPERVDKFLEYLESGDLKPINKTKKDAAFNEYLSAWRCNKKKMGWRDSEIQQAQSEMRAEFTKALSSNFDDLNTSWSRTKSALSADACLNEIMKQFEPLREKLVRSSEYLSLGRLNVSFIKNTFMAISNVGLAPKTLTRPCIPNWFENTSAFITDYLCNRKSDSELHNFIEKEELEPDLPHFKTHLDPWLDEFDSKCKNLLPLFEKGYMLSKGLIMREIDRMSTFLYAVVLNEPEKLNEHRNILDSMIQDAGNLPQPPIETSLLPWISFGQLPLPGGGKKRVISFKFVLDSSLSHQKMNEVLEKLKSLFQSIQVKSTNSHLRANIIQLDAQIDDNVPEAIVRFIAEFADLRIRGVLVGEFGLGGFRHAMNPAYNRIYSPNGVDKAEGFISTYFPGSLDRGGEPYYCPNGWRRYAIDVGMTGSEFESAYRNWHVAYHGTEGHVAMAILLNGVKASGHGCFIRQGEGAVYLSPSIEYSGHPRYAQVWKVRSKYVQMVLQVRVSKKLVFDKKPGTLRGANINSLSQADKNFKNDELEWVIKWPPGGYISTLDGILVYGIMLRVTDDHPENLPQNCWWKGSGP